MKKHPARLACSLATLLLLTLPSIADALEVHVKKLIVTPVGAKDGLRYAGETAYTFLPGEEAKMVCQYEYGKGGGLKEFTPWFVYFTQNGMIIHSAVVSKYQVPHPDPVHVWKADSPGQYKIGCYVEMFKDSDSSNNKAEITVTVKPPPPLAAAQIPVPVPMHPSPGQRQALVPNFSLQLIAKAPEGPVGGFSSMVLYALKSTHVLHWNVEIVRKGGSGKLSYPLATVGQFREQLKYDSWWTSLTKQWLDEHGAGPGQYEARYYYTQIANGVTTKGPAAVVAFELVEPLKAGTQPSGGVKMAPVPGGIVPPQTPGQGGTQAVPPGPGVPPSRLRR